MPPPPTNPVLADGLEINVMEDGFVVYQPSHERVHYLNQTAGLLLELCNGTHSEADLPGLLQRVYDLPSAPVEEVETCIRTLREQGLIR